MADDRFILLHRVLDCSDEPRTARIIVAWEEVRSIEDIVIRAVDSPARAAIEYKDNTMIIVTEPFDDLCALFDHHAPIGFSPGASVCP